MSQAGSSGHSASRTVGGRLASTRAVFNGIGVKTAVAAAANADLKRLYDHVSAAGSCVERCASELAFIDTFLAERAKARPNPRAVESRLRSSCDGSVTPPGPSDDSASVANKESGSAVELMVFDSVNIVHAANTVGYHLTDASSSASQAVQLLRECIAELVGAFNARIAADEQHTVHSIGGEPFVMSDAASDARAVAALSAELEDARGRAEAAEARMAAMAQENAQLGDAVTALHSSSTELRDGAAELALRYSTTRAAATRALSAASQAASRDRMLSAFRHWRGVAEIRRLSAETDDLASEANRLAQELATAHESELATMAKLEQQDWELSRLRNVVDQQRIDLVQETRLCEHLTTHAMRAVQHSFHQGIQALSTAKVRALSLAVPCFIDIAGAHVEHLAEVALQEQADEDAGLLKAEAERRKLLEHELEEAKEREAVSRRESRQLRGDLELAHATSSASRQTEDVSHARIRELENNVDELLDTIAEMRASTGGAQEELGDAIGPSLLSPPPSHHHNNGRGRERREAAASGGGFSIASIPGTLDVTDDGLDAHSDHTRIDRYAGFAASDAGAGTGVDEAWWLGVKEELLTLESENREELEALQEELAREAYSSVGALASLRQENEQLHHELIHLRESNASLRLAIDTGPIHASQSGASTPGGRRSQSYSSPPSLAQLSATGLGPVPSGAGVVGSSFASVGSAFDYEGTPAQASASPARRPRRLSTRLVTQPEGMEQHFASSGSPLNPRQTSNDAVDPLSFGPGTAPLPLEDNAHQQQHAVRSPVVRPDVDPRGVVVSAATTDRDPNSLAVSPEHRPRPARPTASVATDTLDLEPALHMAVPRQFGDERSSGDEDASHLQHEATVAPESNAASPLMPDIRPERSHHAVPEEHDSTAAPTPSGEPVPNAANDETPTSTTRTSSGSRAPRSGSAGGESTLELSGMDESTRDVSLVNNNSDLHTAAVSAPTGSADRGSHARGSAIGSPHASVDLGPDFDELVPTARPAFRGGTDGFEALDADEEAEFLCIVDGAAKAVALSEALMETFSDFMLRKSEYVEDVTRETAMQSAEALDYENVRDGAAMGLMRSEMVLDTFGDFVMLKAIKAAESHIRVSEAALRDELASSEALFHTAADAEQVALARAHDAEEYLEQQSNWLNGVTLLAVDEDEDRRKLEAAQHDTFLDLLNVYRFASSGLKLRAVSNSYVLYTTAHLAHDALVASESMAFAAESTRKNLELALSESAARADLQTEATEIMTLELVESRERSTIMDAAQASLAELVAFALHGAAEASSAAVDRLIEVSRAMCHDEVAAVEEQVNADWEHRLSTAQQETTVTAATKLADGASAVVRDSLDYAAATAAEANAFGRRSAREVNFVCHTAAAQLHDAKIIVQDAIQTFMRELQYQWDEWQQDASDLLEAQRLEREECVRTLEQQLRASEQEIEAKDNALQKRAAADATHAEENDRVRDHAKTLLNQLESAEGTLRAREDELENALTRVDELTSHANALAARLAAELPVARTEAVCEHDAALRPLLTALHQRAELISELTDSHYRACAEALFAGSAAVVRDASAAATARADALLQSADTAVIELKAKAMEQITDLRGELDDVSSAFSAYHRWHAFAAQRRCARSVEVAAMEASELALEHAHVCAHGALALREASVDALRDLHAATSATIRSGCAVAQRSSWTQVRPPVSIDAAIDATATDDDEDNPQDVALRFAAARLDSTLQHVSVLNHGMLFTMRMAHRAAVDRVLQHERETHAASQSESDVVGHLRVQLRSADGKLIALRNDRRRDSRRVAALLVHLHRFARAASRRSLAHRLFLQWMSASIAARVNRASRHGGAGNDVSSEAPAARLHGAPAPSVDRHGEDHGPRDHASPAPAEPDVSTASARFHRTSPPMPPAQGPPERDVDDSDPSYDDRDTTPRRNPSLSSSDWSPSPPDIRAYGSHLDRHAHRTQATQEGLAATLARLREVEERAVRVAGALPTSGRSSSTRSMSADVADGAN